MRVKDISDAGWKNLSRAKIVELAAYDTALEDNSVRHLSNIKELKSLTITNADITDAGIAHLQGHEKLVSIRLKGTKVSKDGIAKLGKAMPSLLRVSLNGERLLNRRAKSTRCAN